MTERDDESPSPPAAEADSSESTQLFALLLPALGVSPAKLGGTLAALAEQWTSVLCQLRQAAAEMVRRLAPRLQALRELAQDPEVARSLQGLAAMGEAMKAAPAYCVPYVREVDRLGLEPLTEQQQAELTVVALLFQQGETMRLGHRPPLEELALVMGRVDITAALVMERAATQRFARGMERGNKQEEGELVEAACSGQPALEPS